MTSYQSKDKVNRRAGGNNAYLLITVLTLLPVFFINMCSCLIVPIHWPVCMRVYKKRNFVLENLTTKMGNDNRLKKFSYQHFFTDTCHQTVKHTINLKVFDTIQKHNTVIKGNVFCFELVHSHNSI